MAPFRSIEREVSEEVNRLRNIFGETYPGVDPELLAPGIVVCVAGDSVGGYKVLAAPLLKDTGEDSSDEFTWQMMRGSDAVTGLSVCIDRSGGFLRGAELEEGRPFTVVDRDRGVNDTPIGTTLLFLGGVKVDYLFDLEVPVFVGDGDGYQVYLLRPDYETPISPLAFFDLIDDTLNRSSGGEDDRNFSFEWDNRE